MYVLYDSRAYFVESRHNTYKAALKAREKLLTKLRKVTRGYEKDFVIMHEGVAGELRKLTPEELANLQILHGR